MFFGHIFETVQDILVKFGKNMENNVIHRTVKETLSRIQLFFVQRKKLFGIIFFIITHMLF